MNLLKILYLITTLTFCLYTTSCYPMKEHGLAVKQTPENSYNHDSTPADTTPIESNSDNSHNETDTTSATEPEVSDEEADTSSYDTDSEDEEGYTYNGLGNLNFPKKLGKQYIPLSRGIHFSRSIFTSEEAKEIKSEDQSQTPIFSSAAYDMAGLPIASTENIELVTKKALETRRLISSMNPEERNTFQQIYSNQYDAFHKKLGTKQHGKVFSRFTSKKNPQLSTSESFRHSARYSAGLKYLGDGIKSLDPKYDASGKPKHPYLGKLFVILLDKVKTKTLDPYFVVWGHANAHIKISDHWSKNILIEREVSFPGFIPGECVVFSVPIRVPSFACKYKIWYAQKYGLTKRMFNMRKKTMLKGAYRKGDKRTADEARKQSTHSFLEKTLLPHLETTLQEHVEQQCKKHGLSLVYKKLNNGFGPSLPSLQNAAQQRQKALKN